MRQRSHSIPRCTLTTCQRYHWLGRQCFQNKAGSKFRIVCFLKSLGTWRIARLNTDSAIATIHEFIVKGYVPGQLSVSTLRQLRGDPPRAVSRLNLVQGGEYSSFLISVDIKSSRFLLNSSWNERVKLSEQNRSRALFVAVAGPLKTRNWPRGFPTPRRIEPRT